MVLDDETIRYIENAEKIKSEHRKLYNPNKEQYKSYVIC